MRKAMALAVVLMVVARMAQAGPGTITYQGSLLRSDGTAVDGSYAMQFWLYDAATGGIMRWTETESAVEVAGGLFSVTLGDGSPFGTLFTTYSDLWLQVAVDFNRNGTFAADETYAPRQKLAGAAWALSAKDAEGLRGRSVLATAPTLGQMLRWNGTAWAPATPANQYPVAILQASLSELYIVGTAPATTTLSLSLSRDPEGGALTYAFDPTGRTTGAPASYGPAATASVAYSGTGNYLAAGWVRDSAGAVSRARALVSVFRWSSATPDSAGLTGDYPSLAVVNGRPAIAYFDFTNYDLKYVRANDSDGAAWGTPLTPDSAGEVGWWPSLAVVNGRPAIAYYDWTNGDLKYVRANDADGAAWGTPATLHSAGNVGHYASLAIVNGRPAIAYVDIINRDLKYVRANDSDGAAWGTPLTPDSVYEVGQHASLAVVNGRPAIAYRDSTNGDLKYIRAMDADGAAWGTPLTPDSVGNVSAYASLAVVNGRPAIAYFDSTNGDLKYVRANDSDGAAWGTPLTPDSAGDVGMYASLAVVNGRPAVAYCDYANRDLKYVRANDADGAAWGTPATLHSAGDVGYDASLAVVNGRPAIAYFDGTDYDLKYTIPMK